MPLLLPSLLASFLGAAPERTLTLVFGGDVIPHDPVKYAAQLHARAAPRDDFEETANHGGWDQVFGALAPAFKRADVAIVNLETPITTRSAVERGEMVFSAPPPLLEALKAAGVTVATFANNHCLDQHPAGIVETRQHLAEAGLLSAGAALNRAEAFAPLVLKRKGVRVGVLAITRWLNGFKNPKDPARPFVPLVVYEKDREQAGLSEASFLDVVAEARASVDVLVVAVHWGVEYAQAPTPEDRAFAQALVDAGATLVIGHHPHVLQPIEHLTSRSGADAVVAWSLGNLVSNQDLADPASLKRDGMLLEVALGVGAGGVRVERVDVVPTWTVNRLAQGKRRNVQAVLLEDEVAAIGERLDALTARPSRASQVEAAGLRARRSVALARLGRVQALVKRPEPPGSAEAAPPTPAALPPAPRPGLTPTRGIPLPR